LGNTITETKKLFDDYMRLSDKNKTEKSHRSKKKRH